MKNLFLIAILCCASAVTLGCRSVHRGDPIAREVPANTPALASGRQLFMRHCNQCHPNGEGGLGPALNDKPAPRFLMKTQVRSGLGAMPSFDKNRISPEDLDDLLDYVVALRKSTHRKS